MFSTLLIVSCFLQYLPFTPAPSGVEFVRFDGSAVTDYTYVSLNQFEYIRVNTSVIDFQCYEAEHSIIRQKTPTCDQFENTIISFNVHRDSNKYHPCHNNSLFCKYQFTRYTTYGAVEPSSIKLTIKIIEPQMNWFINLFIGVLTFYFWFSVERFVKTFNMVNIGDFYGFVEIMSVLMMLWIYVSFVFIYIFS